MKKLHLILRLLFAKRYYVYIDYFREYRNMTLHDMALINNDVANILDNEIQGDVNLMAVEEILNNGK